MKTILQKLTGARAHPDAGCLMCPGSRKNRAIFARNAIPPLREFITGKMMLVIHETNAKGAAR